MVFLILINSGQSSNVIDMSSFHWDQTGGSIFHVTIVVLKKIYIDSLKWTKLAIVVFLLP